MLISHSLRLVFVHIPKTGGQAVSRVLRGAGAWSDGGDHAVLSDVSPYPAFTFVRNPWARFASFWDSIFQLSRLRPMDERGVTEALSHSAMRPQLLWLAHVENVGRYESIAEDFARFTGLVLPAVGVRSRTALNDVAVEMVGKAFAEEIERFGYKRP